MGTVSKALSLLGYFTSARSEIGLSELARLSGLNKATVHRLLTEMTAEGFVEQTPVTRNYRLGPVFPRLAALREAAVPTREAAETVLRDLAEATGETTHMTRIEGGVLSTYGYVYAGSHGTRVTMTDDERLPFHGTASGRCVLAWGAAAQRDAVLAAPLERHTDQTETDPAAIRAALAPIRAQGWSECISGYEEDVHSFAAPLFDAQRQCFAALAVAAPVARMTPDLRATILTALPQAALRLTRLLGGFPPADWPRPKTDTLAAQ